MAPKPIMGRERLALEGPSAPHNKEDDEEYDTANAGKARAIEWNKDDAEAVAAGESLVAREKAGELRRRDDKDEKRRDKEKDRRDRRDKDGGKGSRADHDNRETRKQKAIANEGSAPERKALEYGSSKDEEREDADAGALVVKEKVGGELVSRREADKKEKESSRPGRAAAPSDKKYDAREERKPRALQYDAPERKALEYAADGDHNDDAESQALVAKNRGAVSGELAVREKARPKPAATASSKSKHSHKPRVPEHSSRRTREIEAAPEAPKRKELTYDAVPEHDDNDTVGQLVRKSRKEPVPESKPSAKPSSRSTKPEEIRRTREIEAPPAAPKRKELAYDVPSQGDADSTALSRRAKQDPEGTGQLVERSRKMPEPEPKASTKPSTRAPKPEEPWRARGIEAAPQQPKRKELTYEAKPKEAEAPVMQPLVHRSRQEPDVDPDHRAPKAGHSRQPAPIEPYQERKERNKLPEPRLPSPEPVSHPASAFSDDSEDLDDRAVVSRKTTPDPEPEPEPQPKRKSKVQAEPEPEPESDSDTSYASRSDDDKATRKWRREMRQYKTAMAEYEKKKHASDDEEEPVREKRDRNALVKTRSRSRHRGSERRRYSPSPEDRDRAMTRRRKADVAKRHKYRSESEDSDEEYAVRERQKEKERKKKKKKKAKKAPAININMSNSNNVVM